MNYSIHLKMRHSIKQGYGYEFETIFFVLNKYRNVVNNFTTNSVFMKSFYMFIYNFDPFIRSQFQIKFNSLSIISIELYIDSILL